MNKADPPEALVTLENGVSEKDGAALCNLTADLLNLPRSGAAFVTRAVFLLGDPALTDVQRRFSAPKGTYAVQETQRFTALRDVSLKAGTQVGLPSVSEGSVAHYIFQLPGSDAGMETRVRFLTPDSIRALTAPKLHLRMVGEGAQTLLSTRLTTTAIARYTALAHDLNPLHSSPDVARAAGFGDVIVPGMLLCAFAEAGFRYMSQGTQIQDLRARFLSPALVNTSVQVVVTAQAGAKSRVFVVSDAQDIHAIVDIFTAA